MSLITGISEHSPALLTLFQRIPKLSKYSRAFFKSYKEENKIQLQTSHVFVTREAKDLFDSNEASHR